MASMPYRCLADFLEELGHAGELTRVEEEVDPALEVAEITARRRPNRVGRRCCSGPVKGHHLPVLTQSAGHRGANLPGAGRRPRSMKLADRIARLLDASAPEGWFERLKGGRQPAALSSVMPREVKSAACQQIVRLGSDIDLGELPLLQADTSPNASEGAKCTGPAAGQSRRQCTATRRLCCAGQCHERRDGLSAEPDSHRPVAGRFDLAADRRARGWPSAGPRTTTTPGCWASIARGTRRCRWPW